jgi:hypothetical protein
VPYWEATPRTRSSTPMRALVRASLGRSNPVGRIAHQGGAAALLAQLARLRKNDLRLPLVIADLPRHTDALTAKRILGGGEFRPMPAERGQAFELCVQAWTNARPNGVSAAVRRGSLHLSEPRH